MTNSRSKSNRIVVALLAFIAWIAFMPSAAEAGRKRVVVLELDGPKAEKFHADLVKLIKKAHTVIPLDKWNTTAEDLGATSTSEKDIKKVAKKLKVDAIVFGKIVKRRDEYLIKLQVRAGATGRLLDNRFETKAEGPRIDGEASRDLKDELVESISSMDSAKRGGDDDEEEEEDEDKPVKKGFSRRSKEMAKETAKETEDDENPLPKKKVVKKQEDEQEQAHDDEEKRPAKRKKLASSDDAASDDNSVSDSSDDAADTHRGEALSLGERAVDVILGLSLNRRSMSFASSPGLANKPAPYNGVPVAGAYIDGTVFPLAIGHKREGLVKNFGATLMYDRVLKIESKASGVTYPTTASRYAVGLAFRYPIGHKLVIGARVRYGSRAFTISKVNGEGPGIPNVAYTIIDPTVTFAYQAAPKIAIDAKLGFMAITNTGEIQKPDQYGAATVSGVEGDVGVSYRFANNLFARAAFSFETIGFSFKGTGMLSDPNGDMMKDVSGARDTYLGGSVTAGVLY